MTPSSPVRPLLLAAALLGALAFIGWKGSHLLSDPSVFPPDDFVEYWAAGRLNALGENPYDGNLLLPLERSAGRDTDEPVMMWNPPWTLTLAMPVGLLPARPAQLLWLAVSLVLVVASADRLWAVYGGPADRRWVSWALALTFVPTLFVLQAGQIGPFILAGITGFLLADRAGRPWVAGACGVLMAIKPHIVFLFWVALAGWVLARPAPRRWMVIAGGLLGGLAATLVPVACNPDVLGQYWDAMTNRTPEQWKSPTLGSLLREAFGETLFGLQFLPTSLGLAWLVGRAARHRDHRWEWREQMPLLLLVSFVTASYGAWPFDLVILLPAVIHVAAGLSREPDRRLGFAASVYLAINAGVLGMNLAGITSDRFVWVAPALLAAYLAFRPRPSAP